MSATIITEPGVYDGMPDAVYHADPVPGGSLSSTGARRILKCPARYRYDADHPPITKNAYDLGHGAHLRVLGTGPQIATVDASDWRTKAAAAARAEAYAAGKVPLLVKDVERVDAMADAIRRHPIAGPLFAPAGGVPEQSLFWIDDDSDQPAWCRGRLDWLRDDLGGRVLIPDYKTTTNAAPSALEKTIYNFGYHQQAAWYLDGAQALGLAGDDAEFLFVFQETAAPYLITVRQLDAMALRIGRDLNAQAIDRYRQCRAAGRWPGYVDWPAGTPMPADDDVALIGLPAWVENRYLQEAYQ